MSLKGIADNENGLTYTLEAVLGAAIIIGTVMFMTGSIPYTAQKTGEHSKVQLMNIGRDSLDLLMITPVYETCPDCLAGIVKRTYFLKADKTFVMPGETITFTVYYLNGTIVDKPLTLQQTVLGTKDVINSSTIYGPKTWIINSAGEYDFMAYDASGQSNFVAIVVGYYFLYSDADGVVPGQVVSGNVNDSNGTAIQNLTIRIWGYQGGTLKIMNSSAARTNTTGNFSFVWSESSTGTYYIQAINGTNSSQVSNKHRLVYTSSGSIGRIYSLEETIFETQSTKIILQNLTGSNNLAPISQATIDLTAYLCYNESKIKLVLDPSDPNMRTVIFKAFVAGNYTIFWGNTGGRCSDSSNDNANAAKTNSIVIKVLPLTNEGKTEDTCIDKIELRNYFNNYIPKNINYNLYLIGNDSNRFQKCTKFEDGQLINGYPTHEAVTVNKLVHINYIPGSIDNILEFRMVLWYK